MAETLIEALDQLAAAYSCLQASRCGVPGRTGARTAPLSLAVRARSITHAACPRSWAAAQIYLKREDLNHTGAHKINNTVGQALLAHKMGKKRVIAETGAGQHGVASATVAARFGMSCVVYMGSIDMQRQAQNVYRMRLLGAEVVPVESGSKTLKDALNEAMRDWVTNMRRHLLHHRHGGRAASLSDDGA